MNVLTADQLAGLAESSLPARGKGVPTQWANQDSFSVEP